MFLLYFISKFVLHGQNKVTLKSITKVNYLMCNNIFDHQEECNNHPVNDQRMYKSFDNF